MMENVKISVVIPVYNCSGLLPRAVYSILMQEFSEYEVIIVNDGSTDDTPQVCAELAANDMRVRVINKENGGVSSARNAGIDASRGEYVMFVDADDAIRYGAFELMYDKSSDFVLAGFEKVEGNAVKESYCPPKDCSYHGKDQICSFFDAVLPRKNTYILNSACFKLFRRSVLLDNDIRFVEDISFAEDKLFVMTFLKHVERVRTVSSVAYSYFLRPSSLSGDMFSDAHLKNIFRLLECYAPVLEDLRKIYPNSVRIRSLYHTDLVGRYVCRVLDNLATRKTDFLSKDNIAVLYGYMDGDPSCNVFSLRLGQVPNLVLYKIGNASFTKGFYRFTSMVASVFRRKS